jgi:MoaA/NifB/PqqE/SkfB family radical SAM enzyme
MFLKTEVIEEDIYKFLRYGRQKGHTTINLHGGEPTVYPKLMDLLSEIRRMGYLEIQIQTNARRLAEDRFAQDLVRAGVGLFIVSLHAATPDIHDQLVSTSGGWAETVRGIKNVKSLGAKVRTNIVLTTKNVFNLNEYMYLLLTLGIDHVNISNLHPVGSAYLSFGELMPKFVEIREALSVSIGILRGANIPVTLEGFPFCTVPDYYDLLLERRKRDIPLLWKGQIIPSYDELMDRLRAKGEQCSRCIHSTECGGVYKEYVKYRGWSEIEPVTSTIAA